MNEKEPELNEKKAKELSEKEHEIISLSRQLRFLNEEEQELNERAVLREQLNLMNEEEQELNEEESLKIIIFDHRMKTVMRQSAIKKLRELLNSLDVLDEKDHNITILSQKIITTLVDQAKVLSEREKELDEKAQELNQVLNEKEQELKQLLNEKDHEITDLRQQIITVLREQLNALHRKEQVLNEKEQGLNEKDLILTTLREQLAYLTTGHEVVISDKWREIKQDASVKAPLLQGMETESYTDLFHQVKKEESELKPFSKEKAVKSRLLRQSQAVKPMPVDAKKTDRVVKQMALPSPLQVAQR